MARNTKNTRIIILKMLSRTGYFTVFMEWFVLLALYLPKFIDSDLGKAIFPKAEPQPVTESVGVSSPQEPSGFLIVFIVLAALACIALVLYVIFAKYIPGVTKAAEKVTHAATEKAVPLVAHKPLEKIPARRRKRLTEKVLFWVKTTLAILPTVLVVATRFDEDTIESQLIVLGFAVLTLFALVCFIIQNRLSRRWKIAE